MIYSEENFLLLSGLQHFRFCRRQWALIHIENQWAENGRTVDGAIIHEKAHDQSFTESRGDTVITRGVSVFSHTLGVSGQCDVLEYHRSADGIPLTGREGRWVPFPVEYKIPGICYSYVGKRCVWRKCCAVKFRAVRSITMRSADGYPSPLPRSFAVRSGICWGRCTISIKSSTRRR